MAIKKMRSTLMSPIEPGAVSVGAPAYALSDSRLAILVGTQDLPRLSETRGPAIYKARLLVKIKGGHIAVRSSVEGDELELHYGTSVDALRRFTIPQSCIEFDYEVGERAHAVTFNDDILLGEGIKMPQSTDFMAFTEALSDGVYDKQAAQRSAMAIAGNN